MCVLAKAVKGKGGVCLHHPSFDQPDLSFCWMNTRKVHTAEFAQLQRQEESFTFSASSQYESMPQASALTAATAEPLLQCHCITSEVFHCKWNKAEQGKVRGRAAEDCGGVAVSWAVSLYGKSLHRGTYSPSQMKEVLSRADKNLNQYDAF